MSQTLSVPIRAPETQVDEMIVPDPVGHYMLIALPDIAEQTGGGVLLVEEYRDRERAASVIGTVMALGADCYQGTYPSGAQRFPSGPWCKKGDTVIFGRYAGHRFRVSGVEFRLLADDAIVGTVPTGAKVEGI
jgi:co-chaperonin GroES (HSP10)